MSEPAFWTELQERGVIHQATLPTLGTWIAERIAAGQRLPMYAGFDPTADSLHIGGLMPVLGLRRFKEAGVFPIALVGGATGMIGDPSGKSTERTLLAPDVLAHNSTALARQLETLLDGRAGTDFLVLDNADWIAPLRLVDFLRDVGKYFSVNMMTAKESVRARLEDREHGISYTEFSYMLLQAFDFLHLYEAHACPLQVGGSDQWGNITAGIDLIHHKHHGAEVHGCTFPLITMSDGRKFGKSERGNIWLDPRRTHPYFLYKYFFDLPDTDVVRLLGYLTFVPVTEIRAIGAELATRPELRTGQKTLAREVTAIVHGRTIASACEGLERAMHTDDVEAFEQQARTLGLLEPAALAGAEDAAALPVAHRPLASLAGEGLSAVELAVEIGLFASKGEVRREVQSAQGGFRVAGEQVKDVSFRITADLLGSRRVLQLRRGKKNKRMVCFHD